MGGCFSSGSGGEEAAAGYGGVERQRRVWPSDEDGGRWPYVGERDVDNKAAVFIANFHRHQSGACDCAAADQQAPPAAAAS
ncbi:hypothetical protein ACP70R_028782 [Stipagrostis hirtigluma subsp. patula]